MPQQHHVTSKGRLSPLDAPRPVSASTALGSVGVEEGFEGLALDAQQGLLPLSTLQRAPGYNRVMAMRRGTLVQLGLATPLASCRRLAGSEGDVVQKTFLQIFEAMTHPTCGCPCARPPLVLDWFPP